MLNFKHDSPWEQISCVSSVFMVFWKGDFHVEYFSVSANYLNLQYNFGFLSCESEISTIVRARYIVTRTNSKLSFSWYDDDILQRFTEHFPIRQLDNANDKLIFNLHLLKNSSNYFQALLVLCRNLKEIFSLFVCFFHQHFLIRTWDSSKVYQLNWTGNSIRLAICEMKKSCLYIWEVCVRPKTDEYSESIFNSKLNIYAAFYPFRKYFPFVSLSVRPNLSSLHYFFYPFVSRFVSFARNGCEYKIVSKDLKTHV